MKVTTIASQAKTSVDATPAVRASGVPAGKANGIKYASGVGVAQFADIAPSRTKMTSEPRHTPDARRKFRDTVFKIGRVTAFGTITTAVGGAVAAAFVPSLLMPALVIPTAALALAAFGCRLVLMATGRKPA